MNERGWKNLNEVPNLPLSLVVSITYVSWAEILSFMNLHSVSFLFPKCRLKLHIQIMCTSINIVMENNKIIHAVFKK